LPAQQPCFARRSFCSPAFCVAKCKAFCYAAAQAFGERSKKTSKAGMQRIALFFATLALLRMAVKQKQDKTKASEQGRLSEATPKVRERGYYYHLLLLISS
jgi:hypothetical protein